MVGPRVAVVLAAGAAVLAPSPALAQTSTARLGGGWTSPLAAPPAPGASPAAPGAATTGARPRPEPEADPDAVLVRFRAVADAGTRAAALRRAGSGAARAVGATRWSLVATRGRPPADVVRALEADPAVADAAPNLVRRSSAVPDDPLWAKRQGALGTLRLPAAWDLARATSAQVVAVLDTGVDADHPDLAGRVLPGRDVVNADASAIDDHGHGTAVASVAAARANDATGIAGVSWGASVLPVKVLDGQGSGTDADVAAGITWAADQGADVINLSLGGPGASPVLADAVAHARARGAVVVAAAGNDGYPIETWPAAAPGAIAIGATGWDGSLAWYSNTGAWVDLAAPGHEVRAARMAEDGLGGWSELSGTSLSTPVVAGVAALLVAQHPEWGPAQVEERLLATALDAGPDGVDPFYGRGLVDPVAALGGAPAPPVAGGAPDGDSMDRPTVLAAAGATATGHLDREGDGDWFAIDVTQPSTLGFNLYPARTREVGRAQAVDGVLDVFDPQRRPRYHVDSWGLDHREWGDLELPVAGRWWVRVSSSASSRDVGEPYELFVAAHNPGPGRVEPRFTWPLDHTRDVRTLSVAVADVTGDGRAEALWTSDSRAAGHDEDYSLFVHEVDPEGVARPPRVLDTGARIMWTSDGGSLNSSDMGLATGDLDGDGATDVAVAAGRWLAIFHQRSGQLAATPAPVPDSQGADQVEAADVDRDGRLDLVANLNRSGAPEGEATGVFVFRRTESGGWSRRAVPLAGLPDFAVGDVTGDGRLDVVGAGWQSVLVSRQLADGSFAAAETYADDVSEGLDVGDVNGDGRADVVTTSHPQDGATTLDVRLQTAGGTLAAPVSLPTLSSAQAIRVADVDGDGRRDVLAMGDLSGHLALFRQRADGTLGPEERTPITAYPIAYRPTGIAVGDLTRDGATDVALADGNYGLVLLHQRTADFPRPPWVRDAVPSDGQAGVAGTVTPSIRTGVALDPASLGAVRLEDARGAAVAATPSYDPATRTLLVRPAATLATGRYAVQLGGVRDVRGLAAPEGLAVRFTVGTADTTAPDTLIRTAPQGTTREQFNTRYVVEALEPGTRMQCSLDGAPWTACAPRHNRYEDLAHGTHTFRARAVDGAGRVDSTPATRTWTINTSLAPPPNDRWDDAQAIGGVTGSVSATTTGATFDSLYQAQFTTDDGGERSVWWRWTAPATGVVTFDTAGSAFDTLLAVFAGAPNAGLRRRAEDDDAPGVRTSRVRVPVRAGEVLTVGVDGVTDGRYAANGAVTLAWSLAAAGDTAAPETSFTGGPRSPETTGRATFTWASSEPGSTFECRLDGEGWIPCSPPRTLYLGNGDHVHHVRATDAAGNADATPATWAWRADALPPETRFTSVPPDAVSSSSVSFAWVADEPATFECRVDRGAWAACTSPRTIPAGAPGPHELDVRARDVAGNLEPQPARRAWVVLADTTPPDTRITSGPAPTSRLTSARFTLTSTEAGSTFECRLDAGAWAPCASPHAVSGLAPGAHTLAARALDGAGNADPTPATRSWAVDPAAPVQGDFNADGRPDLAIGAPAKPVAGHAGAGAVLVLPAGAPTGSKLWHQDVSGVTGTAEPGDGFGAALAAGDLNADGYDDLAIGVPGEDAGAGAVLVLRGSSRGLTTSGSKVVDQGTSGVADDKERDDRFGAALAAARLDADEREELVVGAPGEGLVADGVTLAGAGAVHVLPGSTGGPTATGSRFLHRAVPELEGEPAAGDAFGAALATADLGGTAAADLAVGAPGADVGGTADAGAVHVLPAGEVAGDSVWVQGADGVPDVSEIGDRFGAALAAGPLGNGGRADLAVGAPGEGVGSLSRAGQLTVLYGTDTGLAAAGATVLRQGLASVPSSAEVGDGFAAALAVTRPLGGGRAWLAVGAPDEDDGSTADAGWAVALPASAGALSGTGHRRFQPGLDGLPETPEAGDRLGARLGAVGGGLALGAPHEDVGTLADAGAVLVLPGSADGPVATGSRLVHLDVSGVAGTAAAGDRLGDAL